MLFVALVLNCQYEFTSTVARQNYGHKFELPFSEDVQPNLCLLRLHIRGAGCWILWRNIWSQSQYRDIIIENTNSGPSQNMIPR